LDGFLDLLSDPNGTGINHEALDECEAFDDEDEDVEL
jgi:hypothetical protein